MAWIETWTIPSKSGQGGNPDPSYSNILRWLGTYFGTSYLLKYQLVFCSLYSSQFSVYQFISAVHITEMGTCPKKKPFTSPIKEIQIGWPWFKLSISLNNVKLVNMSKWMSSTSGEDERIQVPKNTLFWLIELQFCKFLISIPWCCSYHCFFQVVKHLFPSIILVDSLKRSSS